MGRRKKGQPVSGWINLDKPVGIGSTKALSRVRKFLDAQKAGHAGTLDPLASGILPIALGEATKVIPFIQDAAKTYAFTIKWGEATDTDDTEGNIIKTSPNRPKEQDILKALPDFTGEITQIPPKYSAIKIDGQRAYDLARSGADIEMKSRQVVINQLELLEARRDAADFRVNCGKGTYVRSLARDIAEKLGTYGHIIALRRESVGYFTLQSAISLEILENLINTSESFPKNLISELLRSKVCPSIIISLSEFLRLSISIAFSKFITIMVPPLKSILSLGPLFIISDIKPIDKTNIESILVIPTLLIKS